MLDEQWRMASPISKAVSDIFYDSKLKVAEPALNNDAWIKARTPKRTKLLNPDHVILIDVNSSAIVGRRNFNGYYSPESAELIAALAVDLRCSCPDEGLLILTPYRAQRSEIQKQLQSVNAESKLASTVHRAQGSECHTVIFDPVCPGSKFVAGEEGMRLVNVALSRAKCRLIVLMHPDWIENKALRTLRDRFPRLTLDATKVNHLLNQKVIRVAEKTDVAPTVHRPEFRLAPQSTPQPQTLLESFIEELQMTLAAGPNTKEYRDQVFRDICARAKFNRKFTYAERDSALEKALSKLAPRRSSANTQPR